MLLYLSLATWRDASGEVLANEVRAARVAGLKVVMVHENDEDRGGCKFSLFFTTTCAAAAR